MAENEELKFQGAQYAVEYVESGMIVGLGHGSTASLAAKLITGRLNSGSLRNILCVPASDTVEKAARSLNLPLTTLDEHPVLDLTIDGADEVNPALELIKGGGGALLKEKMLAQASRREMIVVDQSKLSPVLGEKWALPVEVIPFGWRYQVIFLEQLGAIVKVRYDAGGLPFETDQGNMILDCDFGPITNPQQLAEQLNGQAGIIEHGLFLDLVDDLVVGSEQGVRHIKKTELNNKGGPGN